MNILNFKKFKKLKFFVLALLVLLSVCSQPKEKILRGEEEKKFSKLQFKKIVEFTLYYGQWCVPFQNKILCNQVLDSSRSHYRLILYDHLGKIIKERIVKGGTGPDEILAIGEDSLFLSANGRILCIDENYLKEIDQETLEIKTIAKLDNLIKDYMKKYIFGRLSYTSIENRGDITITSFESTGFAENGSYYIVKYEGLFKNLKLVAELKKRKETVWGIGFNELRKKKFIVDYYHMLRPARCFSVHWESGSIYYVPEIERPEIGVIKLSGGREEKYKIDIDFKSFKISEKELKFYYDYFMNEVPPYFKDFKHILYIPDHAPPLHGIKVINDWLLIITGKRNWQVSENKVLVYKIPSLKYEGSFYIPFPNAPFLIPKWSGRYYITKQIVIKGEDCYTLFQIYKIEEK